LRGIWGYPGAARTRTLDAHACRLRKNLERARATAYVVNRRAVCYRLVGQAAAVINQGQPGAVSPNGSGALVEFAGVRRAA
jgi:Transcriptional regulatory protein, C terminal